MRYSPNNPYYTPEVGKIDDGRVYPASFQGYSDPWNPPQPHAVFHQGIPPQYMYHHAAFANACMYPSFMSHGIPPADPNLEQFAYPMPPHGFSYPEPFMMFPMHPFMHPVGNSTNASLSPPITSPNTSIKSSFSSDTNSTGSKAFKGNDNANVVPISRPTAHKTQRVTSSKRYPSLPASECTRVVKSILKRPAKLQSTPKVDAKPNALSSTYEAPVQSSSELELDINPTNAKYFLVYCPKEDDVYISVKYGIWSCTRSGKKTLQNAFKNSNNIPVYLLFFPLDTNHFCGMAKVTGPLEDIPKLGSTESFGKWKSGLKVDWMFLKDIERSSFSPSVQSRLRQHFMTRLKQDCEEVSVEEGSKMLKVILNHSSNQSLKQDFAWHERNLEMKLKSAPKTFEKRSSNVTLQQNNK